MRLVTIAVLALALAIAAPAGAASKEFSIGVSLPLTGLFGKDGALVKDAYTLWAETVNRQGGIKSGGKSFPVKLVFYDDQSNPQVSAKLIQKLITKDKVDLLLGGFGSSQVMAASVVSERYGFPLISGAASSNKLFTRGFKYYFATLGKATDEVRGAVEVFKALRPRVKTVAIVGANIPFTALACQGYKRYAEQYGFEVVHFELFPLKLQDYNTMLAKAMVKKPDLLLVGSHLAVSLRVMKAMKEMNFNPKGVAFSYGPTVPAFIKGLGKDAEYVFAASEWTPNLPYKGPVFGSAAEFDALYQKRYQRKPDYVEAASAAGAVAQQKAVEKLGITPPVSKQDRERLMRELHQRDLMTFYGRVRFAADGANTVHTPVAVQVQGGKLVNVFPAAAAEGPPRFPMPSWDKR